MPQYTVTDLQGCSMKLYALDKKPQYFSPISFNHEFIQDMNDYPLRDDDIMFCSYPKSGCHWIWDITRMVLNGYDKVDEMMKERYMMEVANQRHGQIDDLPSPRILNNHQFFENQPHDLVNKGNKVVFVYRNPKDVAVSMYYHALTSTYYKLSDFASYLPRFAEGLVSHNSVFDYLKDWERGFKLLKEENYCIISYEDVQEEPLRELRKLSKFLGKDQDDEYLQRVIEATKIDNMRSVKVKADGNKMGSAMYRKGKVGDWKNHFTVTQSEWYDHIIRTRMGTCKMFNFKYEI